MLILFCIYIHFNMRKEWEANILSLLKEKIPVETISRITHYSLDQIQELRKMHGLL